MAGFRGAQSRAYRFRIAHLTDHDHVGVLAEDRAQSGLEAARIDPNLPLVDDRPVWHEEILDRVLDRNNMIGALVIDLIDESGQARGFAVPGRAYHEKEALRS